jgi:hypothetical protein
LRNARITPLKQGCSQAAVISILWFKGGGRARSAESLFLISKVTQCLGAAVVRRRVFRIDCQRRIECAERLLHLRAVLLYPSGVPGCTTCSHSGET